MKKITLILFLAIPLIAAIAAAEPAPDQTVPETGFLNLHNPWADTAAPAPPAKPYQLPRYGGNVGDHWTPAEPLKTAPRVDAEGLFYSVLACYPEKSKFAIEVDLETRFANRSSYDATGADIGQHYVGIVARMPLYSATELSRERDREYSRRTDTAKTIGQFMQALARRNHAIRELGLYTSLEARAQIRVAQGVADTAEQVRYLEKVATAQSELIRYESDLIEHRLALVSQCADGKSDGLNTYIKSLAELPRSTAKKVTNQ